VEDDEMTSTVSSQSKYFSNVDSAVRKFFCKGQEGKYSGMKSGSKTNPGTQHDDLENIKFQITKTTTVSRYESKVSTWIANISMKRRRTNRAIRRKKMANCTWWPLNTMQEKMASAIVFICVLIFCI
jgi:hypothetical protein